MEWIDALSIEQLKNILHTAASNDPSIGPSIRNAAKAPLVLDKYDFLFNAEEEGLPPSVPLCLKKRKAEEWLSNCDKYVLSNTIVILKAITEAVIDSILHEMRPDADLFVTLFIFFFFLSFHKIFIFIFIYIYFIFF